MIHLGKIPAVKSVEELFRKSSSRALRFVGRIFMLAVTSAAWFFVLIGAAALLLVHLMVAPIARGTFATLSAALDAEASANDDMTTALAKVRGRAASPGPIVVRDQNPAGPNVAPSQRDLVA